MVINKAKGFVRFFSLAVLFVTFFLISAHQPALAEDTEEDGKFNPSELIMHHVVDDHKWHFFDGHFGTLHLPIIVYSKTKGLDVFSSSNFYDEHHHTVDYNGYHLEHNKISLVGDETSVYDFSISKTVLMLFIVSLVLILIFTAVAKAAKRNKGKAPKGIQSAIEPIVIYLRDEVIKPNIGPNYEKYLPYLLSLFFFIWIGNLLGLLPGAANLTGNISITLVLAVFTFLIVNFNGNKNYWKHIFATPGVPAPILPMIVLVEIIGVFTKPFALMIRLFVAITAGHVVILSLIALIFIFQSWSVGFGSTLVVVFINLIELLVATIQAYVFTMFSALYIGLAIEEHHDDH